MATNPINKDKVKVRVIAPDGLTEGGKHYAKGATLEVGHVRFLQLSRGAVVIETRVRGGADKPVA